MSGRAPSTPEGLIVVEGDKAKVERSTRFFQEANASLRNTLEVIFDIRTEYGRAVAQRDRLAQACRLLRDTSSVDSYTYSVVAAALDESGVPEPSEEDHP